MALWKDPSVKDSVPGDAPGSTTDAAARPAEPRPAPARCADLDAYAPVRSPLRPQGRRRSR